MPPNGRRVRVGIDVGGTFTKAVALDSETGGIVAKSTVPTTHGSGRGVSDGVVESLRNIMGESGVDADSVDIISHSTTQAVNALLESDVHRVGIVAMGVGPTKKDVVKRTRLDGGGGRGLSTCHAYLDTSHLITEGEVDDAVSGLVREGAEAIVAAEAFGVDDPSNERFVMEAAARRGVPATGSHEVSGIYGLEIRTLTSVINASVLPKTLRVANFVEGAIRGMGVKAPLMVMKGDGGVTGMDAFRTKPILTVLSGPAASVAGALLHLRVSDGVFVEVGGTSTNVCAIRGGRPEFRYVTIRDHPTCIRSMDVRIVGVAGGSMVRLDGNRVSGVGPRSAHIAGLKYSCFADADDLEGGRIVMVRPKPGDGEYACVECGAGTYAITTTCAANALGMVEEGDHSRADAGAARAALGKLGDAMGVSYFEAAQSVIQTASFEVTRVAAKIMRDYKMDRSSAGMIGGGGGASVLVPFVAKQAGVAYRLAEHAEVISSIGVASSMLREEAEVSMAEPTPERISAEHRRVLGALVERGAVPESVVVDSSFVPEKAVLRITAVGNVGMEGGGAAPNAFTRDELRLRAAEAMGADAGAVEDVFASEHHFAFGARVKSRRPFGRARRRVAVLDVFGRRKAYAENAEVFAGRGRDVADSLGRFLDSRRFDIMPEVHLVTGMKAMDFSGLTSRSHIMDAVAGELVGDEEAMVLVGAS